MQRWYLEEKCRNCGRIFKKFHKSHVGHSNKLALRPSSCFTCSMKCSKEYGRAKTLARIIENQRIKRLKNKENKNKLKALTLSS